MGPDRRRPHLYPARTNGPLQCFGHGSNCIMLEDALVVAKPIPEELEVLQSIPPNRFYTSSAPWFGWIGPAFSIPGTLKTTARQGRLLNHPQPLSIKIGRAWVSLLKGSMT